MTKTSKFTILLLILTLPALFLMVKMTIYPSHDGLYHIERINDFHLAFLSGQIPVRIVPTISERIGFPLFIVNYHFPYYLAEIFMPIFANPIIAFKSVLATTYILSVLFSFLLFHEIGTNLASLTGAIVFSYLPYRFDNIYTRGALGESVAIMFMPLTLLVLHKLKNQSMFAQLLLIFSLFGLITTHTLIFALFLPFLIFYFFLFLKPDKAFIKKVAIAFILAIAASSFQLIPAIFEKKFTKFDVNFLTIYKGHFLRISQILRIPFPGTNLGTPLQAGITAFLITIASTIFLIFRKNKFLIFFICVFFFSIFLSSNYSKWLWDHTLLNYIVFPWRFLSITLLAAAFLSVYLIDNFKYKKLLAITIIAFSIITSRHYILRPTQYEFTPTSQGPSLPNEFDTIWANEKTYFPRPFITPTKSISISNLNFKGSDFYYEETADQATTIIMRRIYFPGWHVSVDNREVPIIIKDGLISVNVPEGTHKISVNFKEDPLRKFADLLSLVSFVFIILLAWKKKIK